MSGRGKFIGAFTAMAVAAGVLWTVVGGITVASGQEKTIEIHRAHAGSYRPSFTEPIFILALGSDSGAPRYGRGGTVAGGRSDSIHIIAINPVLKKATLVGIPRDSYVQTACGGLNKINAAMFFGGPKCLIKTIEALSGNKIHFAYYMVGSFDALENMVNDIGGVPVTVDPGFGSSKKVLQDPNSKAKGIRKGAQTLNGHDALAYSRDRHDYARGDFDRSIHQGQVMIGGLTKARALVAVDPGKTLTFLRSIFRNVKTDIPLLEAFRLGLLLLQIPPANVKNVLIDCCRTGSTPKGSSVFITPGPILSNLADDALIN